MRKLKEVFKWVIFVLLINSALGQQVSLGSCRSFTPSANYMASRLTRTWYVYGSTPSIFSSKLRCTTVTISASTAPFNVLLTAFKGNTASTITVGGTLTFPSGNGVGRFILSYTYASGITATKYSTTYTVIDIESSATPTYAVLYSCKDLGFAKLESVVVLTTSKNPATIPTTTLINLGINVKLRTSIQLGC